MVDIINRADNPRVYRKSFGILLVCSIAFATQGADANAKIGTDHLGVYLDMSNSSGTRAGVALICLSFIYTQLILNLVSPQNL